MKHSIPLQPISAAFAVLVFSSTACADDLIKQQILKLYPQADTDKHVVISDAEDAALSRLALKRHPNADTDGDGVLFDSEKKVRLRLIANRVAAIAETSTSETRRSPQRTPTSNTSDTSSKSSTFGWPLVLSSRGVFRYLDTCRVCKRR